MKTQSQSQPDAHPTPAEQNTSPKTRPPKAEVRYMAWLALALILAVSSWTGLWYLFTHVPAPLPLTWGKILAFLGLWGGAWLGSSWPILLAINQRLRQQAPPARIWRQSAWVALYSMMLAWLQMNRTLTLSLVVILGGALGLMEALLLIRQQEQADRIRVGSQQ